MNNETQIYTLFLKLCMLPHPQYEDFYLKALTAGLCLLEDLWFEYELQK